MHKTDHHKGNIIYTKAGKNSLKRLLVNFSHKLRLKSYLPKPQNNNKNSKSNSAICKMGKTCPKHIYFCMNSRTKKYLIPYVFTFYCKEYNMLPS